MSPLNAEPGRTGRLTPHGFAATATCCLARSLRALSGRTTSVSGNLTRPVLEAPQSPGVRTHALSVGRRRADGWTAPQDQTDRRRGSVPLRRWMAARCRGRLPDFAPKEGGGDVSTTYQGRIRDAMRFAVDQLDRCVHGRGHVAACKPRAGGRLAPLAVPRDPRSSECRTQSGGVGTAGPHRTSKVTDHRIETGCGAVSKGWRGQDEHNADARTHVGVAPG